MLISCHPRQLLVLSTIIFTYVLTSQAAYISCKFERPSRRSPNLNSTQPQLYQIPQQRFRTTLTPVSTNECTAGIVSLQSFQDNSIGNWKKSHSPQSNLPDCYMTKQHQVGDYGPQEECHHGSIVSDCTRQRRNIHA